MTQHPAQPVPQEQINIARAAGSDAIERRPKNSTHLAIRERAEHLREAYRKGTEPRLDVAQWAHEIFGKQRPSPEEMAAYFRAQADALTKLAAALVQR